MSGVRRIFQSGSEKGSGCSRCGEMMRMFAGMGDVETRYDVDESDARLSLNIFVRFEGVNGTKKGFSRLSLRGRLRGVTGSTEPLVTPKTV